MQSENRTTFQLRSTCMDKYFKNEQNYGTASSATIAPVSLTCGGCVLNRDLCHVYGDLIRVGGQLAAPSPTDGERAGR